MNSYYGWWLPFNASVQGGGIDRLITIFHIFMIVFFAGWLIYLITALIKFRARPGHKVASTERHFKVPTYLEIFVALFEAALLVGFSFPIFHAYRNELPPKEEAMEVRVIAEQFAWNVHYPGPDGVFGKTRPELIKPGNPIGLDPSDPKGKDDIVKINQLHVPVHKPVIVYLSSKDVIHSFFIPVMRVKQDAIPGQEIPVWFEAAKTGKFEIACAQLCGLGHYRMRGFFTIHDQAAFQSWLKENRQPSLTPHKTVPL